MLNTFRLKTFILTIILFSCSEPPQKIFKIALSPYVFRQSSEPEYPYMLGFVLDVIKEIEDETKISIEIVYPNQDSIWEDLSLKRYDGLLSKIFESNFIKNSYQFSDSILDITPVIITSKRLDIASITKNSDLILGYLPSDETWIKKIAPQKRYIKYHTQNDIVTALETKDIDIAILSKMYVWQNWDKSPFNIFSIPEANNVPKQTIRIVSLKENKNISAISDFLKKFVKTEKYKNLKKKWLPFDIEKHILNLPSSFPKIT